MKVTKLDVSTQTAVQPQDASAAGQEIMSDLFNMLLQARDDAAMAPADRDVELSSANDTSEPAVETTTLSQQTAGTDDDKSVILAQLNMMNARDAAAQNAPMIPAASDAKSNLSLSDVKQTQATLKSPMPTLPQNNSAQVKLDVMNDIKEMKEAASAPVSQVINANKNNNVKNDDMKNTSVVAPTTIASNENSTTHQQQMVDQLMRSQKINDMTRTGADAEKLTQTTKLPDSDADELAKASDKVDMFAPVMKTTAAPVKKAEMPHLNEAISKVTTIRQSSQDAQPVDAHKDVPMPSPVAQHDAHDQASLPVPQKYMDAFTQLGTMINHQTSQLFNSASAQKSVSDLNTAQFSNSPHLNDGVSNLRAELSAPIVNSLQKDNYEASIKIYPPELGAVTAKLHINKNSAELIILTDNNHVKSIVEANLPKLRENFQQADLNLTSIQVQTNTSQTRDQTDSRHNQQDTASSARPENSDLADTHANSPQTTAKKGSGIIDTYA